MDRPLVSAVDTNTKVGAKRVKGAFCSGGSRIAQLGGSGGSTGGLIGL